MTAAIDLTGKKFGRLLVVERAASKNGVLSWLCRCDCGESYQVKGCRLREGETKSCGCLKREKLALGNPTHRLSRHMGRCSRAYRAWSNMMRRCYDAKGKQYADYGGRGVRVCGRWHLLEDFVADMGEPPPGLTLDRFPNNNGDYGPGNCRWATRKEQQNNRRNNVVIAHNGKTQTVAQWAEDLGINHKTLRNRLARGWTVKEALVVPFVEKYLAACEEYPNAEVRACR